MSVVETYSALTLVARELDSLLVAAKVSVMYPIILCVGFDLLGDSSEGSEVVGRTLAC